jgi:hypothetical protein
MLLHVALILLIKTLQIRMNSCQITVKSQFDLIWFKSAFSISSTFRSHKIYFLVIISMLIWNLAKSLVLRSCRMVFVEWCFESPQKRESKQHHQGNWRIGVDNGFCTVEKSYSWSISIVRIEIMSLSRHSLQPATIIRNTLLMYSQDMSIFSQIPRSFWYGIYVSRWA